MSSKGIHPEMINPIERWGNEFQSFIATTWGKICKKYKKNNGRRYQHETKRTME